MKRIITLLITLIGLTACSTSDLWDAGKHVWENVEFSYGKKEGEEPIDSMVIHHKPVYTILYPDSLAVGEEFHNDNGDCWQYLLKAEEFWLVEAGAFDTIIYIYRKK